MRTGFIIACLVIIALDIYAFKGLKLLIRGLKKRPRKAIHTAYWMLTLFLVLSVLGLVILGRRGYSTDREYFWMFVIGSLFISVVPKLVFAIFHLADDIRHLLVVFRKKYLHRRKPLPGERISRGRFLTQAGLYVATIPFVSIAYGILKGKYDFRVLAEKIFFPHLPASFNGLRIVQISDLHLGSFLKKYESLEPAIRMINDLKPDLLFFTGDMVNNYADETGGWAQTLSAMQARLGKYAVLGNHDYSDYVTWEREEAKEENLEKLKNFIRSCGFRLLLNENEKLSVAGESISIIGVENWGKAKWSKQYGDLGKAMQNVPAGSFSILLSHDPSHWDAQVLEKTNISLTLSGHTHGMQFGVEVGNIKWSPVKNFYPRWGGLYKEDSQYLYVNRGLGFIGFPGRVGMPPEITLIELFRGTL